MWTLFHNLLLFFFFILSFNLEIDLLSMKKIYKKEKRQFVYFTLDFKDLIFFLRNMEFIKIFLCIYTHTIYILTVKCIACRQDVKSHT